MAEISILPFETVQTGKNNSGNKQDKLISGENIKTINGETILGEGDLDITPDALKSFITIAPLSNSRAIIDAFNKYSLNKKIGKLIPAFIKKESFDKDYTLAILVVEDYNKVQAGWRLTFTLLGCKSQTDPNDLEAIYSPDIFTGVSIISYLYNSSSGYVIPLGEGNTKDRRVDELIKTAVTTNTLTNELSKMSAQIKNDVISAVQKEKSDVFEAIYGVTTYNEIVAAVKAQKHVICFYNNKVYNLNNFGEGWDLNFSCAGEVLHIIKCTTQNKWSSLPLYFEQTNYKVQSISDKSTNTQYPSAKAVYDFVNNTLGTIINGDY